MIRTYTAAMFFALALVNCGEIETSKDDAGKATKIAPFACTEGESKRAGDGCNTCTCYDGNWACTEKGCSAKTEKPEGLDCVEELPPELEARIQAAYGENQKARDEAVASERQRLDVTPLLPSHFLGHAEGSAVNIFKPDTDPFPQSVVAVGAPLDIRADGYELNHGKMGMTRVYETAPGSKKFFIVDRIGGDGVGGNGKAVVEESFAYGLFALYSENDPLKGASWHSWHVSKDNKLVRANQAPTDQLQNEARICGCGSLGYEQDSESSVSGDMAPPRYQIGIFMLPGDVLPEILPEDAFQAKFIRKYFKKTYVPSPGKVCREYEIVC